RPALLGHFLGPVPDRPQTQALRRGDGQHVTLAGRLNRAAQGGVCPINAVARHPGKWEVSGTGAVQHRSPDLGLGRERDLVRNTGFSAARAIGRPGLGPGEGTIEEDTAMAARASEDDTNFTRPY